jgi:phosphatidylinositol glycan class M
MYAFWYYYFGGETTGNQACLHITNSKINETQPNWKLRWISYLIYGLWVHIRLYPIILLPLLLFHEYESRNKSWKALFRLFVELGIGAGGVFIGLGALFYAIYGSNFIQETFLYHFSRLDNRHSFSPYFYEIYLNYILDTASASRSLIRLIPTLYIIFTSVRFLRGYSPFYLHFLATYAFVSFNKVITMQYYMWIFGALILALPDSLIFTQKRFRMGYGLILQYFLPILTWIWLSMKMENDGENHLHIMWIICLFQIYMHLWVLTSFMKTIRCYNPFEEKKRRL